MKFVNPTNDVAFKRIFGNENKKEILIDFLNAVLDLHGEQAIRDIEILNPYQAPRIEALKFTVLDVHATDHRGVSFIVEMQVEYVAGYRKRFLYYASKAYVSQIERAEDYPRLNQVIFIGILGFSAFSSEHYITRHLIVNQENGQQEIEDLEFNFIELPKFTKAEEELDTILDKWIYFIKHASTLDAVPPSADSEPLRSAYDMANQFGWSREELEVYDYWAMKMQDERGAIEGAMQQGIQIGEQRGMEQGMQIGEQRGMEQGMQIGEQRGMEQGMQIGEQRGMEQGMQIGEQRGMEQGMEQGEKQKARAIARTLLARGMDRAQVADITALSLDEIAALSEDETA
jgi:predicted transposase/invertase (TIGR01784 family)